ncbi:endonuclease/exonuclease/phosphatase family protein [Nocardia sp. NBC_01730]|uniref:endonuclease/exonuclease/phosphatase family protein n=1 Tax=Nocardia sp. NBC_01730 TaxID=2975998 RepID=UPI002E152501|nr:endonuclease/exonuclease/phosphatase family protein [Nocardia sp. NBC_01730]
MRGWADRALLEAGWCAVAAGAVGIVLHFGAWQRRWLVVVASGASYLMIGAVVGLVLFLIARRWRSAAVAGVLAAATLWTLVPAFVPEGRATSGTQLTVMQSNLLFGGADPVAVVRAVRENRIDVLTVDELTDQAIERLTIAGIQEDLPYHYTEPTPTGGGGTGIYSRYPLRDTTKYVGFILNNVSATMDHPERGPITVFALHPVPPLAFKAWTAEMRRVREILDARTGPAIVGADFNATRDHAAYRDLLRGRFASAADQTGAGLLPTFPNDRGWGPVIGIDHILLAEATAEKIHTLTVPGSDHRAVLAQVRFH